VLKQESRPQTAPVETTTELWAFFRGEFVPLRDANINVMTHGFNYGTAVFEGVRAYWSAEVATGSRSGLGRQSSDILELRFRGRLSAYLLHLHSRFDQWIFFGQ